MALALSLPSRVNILLNIIIDCLNTDRLQLELLIIICYFLLICFVTIKELALILHKDTLKITHIVSSCGLNALSVIVTTQEITQHFHLKLHFSLSRINHTFRISKRLPCIQPNNNNASSMHLLNNANIALITPYYTRVRCRTVKD